MMRGGVGGGGRKEIILLILSPGADPGTPPGLRADRKPSWLGITQYRRQGGIGQVDSIISRIPQSPLQGPFHSKT